MEGQDLAVHKMKELFGGMLHHKIFIINSCDKVKYHAAAAFASNYVTGILHIATGLLQECGFEESDALKLLAPVVKGNINSVLERGTVNALTGPAERNDISTVQGHLDVLGDKDICRIYKDIGKVLVSIAEEKNPGTDYAGLKDMLS